MQEWNNGVGNYFILTKVWALAKLLNNISKNPAEYLSNFKFSIHEFEASLQYMGYEYVIVT